MASLATPLGQPTPTAAPTVPVVPAAQSFDVRIAVGLFGVLLAPFIASLNGHVARIATTDVCGALAIGHDEGTQLTVFHEATQIAAMALTSWCSVIFSLHCFTFFTTGGSALLVLLCPFASNLESLLVPRTLQGLTADCLPPILMAAALHFLSPGIKLYGLGACALAITFGPNSGLSLAALWFERVSWQQVFWQVIPLYLVAMAAVSPVSHIHPEPTRPSQR